MLMVGSDPEMQLINRNGEVISAIDLIPGTKENPFKTKHGSVQWDNIFAEVNSLPSKNADEFVLHHHLILNDLRDIIKPLDLNLQFMASVLAGPSLLSDPRANQAGCDPDFSAWELCPNEPADYSVTSIRASGGHLHCSFDQAKGEDGEENRIKFVRALDLVLGVPSTIHDRDTDRRKYYGKAGSFRPKYSDQHGYDGVEYRTLSNFWLKSDDLMRMVFSGVELVHNNLDHFSSLAEQFKDDIISIINNGDYKSAQRLSKEVGLCV